MCLMLQVVPVLLGTFECISSVRINMPDDLRSKDVRQGFAKAIDEIISRFPKGIAHHAVCQVNPSGIPVLDPVEDMKIKSDDMVKTAQRVVVLEERMVAHSLHKHPQLESLMALATKKQEACDDVCLLISQCCS